MQYRKGVYLAVALALLLLSGCANHELPSDIKNVGGSISKEANVLPSANEIPDPTPSSSPGTASQGSTVQVEQVKSWVASLVNGDYTTLEDGASVTETAPMSDGGTVAISTYGGYYYSTDFLYKLGAEGMLDNVLSCVSTYIGRALTDAETEELAQAINGIPAATKDGNDMELVQIEAFTGTAQVYVMTQSGMAVIQCR